MTECHTDGCTDPADHTVAFEEPDAEHAYCDSCAEITYFAFDSAVSMSKGAE